MLHTGRESVRRRRTEQPIRIGRCGGGCCSSSERQLCPASRIVGWDRESHLLERFHRGDEIIDPRLSDRRECCRRVPDGDAANCRLSEVVGDRPIHVGMDGVREVHGIRKRDVGEMTLHGHVPIRERRIDLAPFDRVQHIVSRNILVLPRTRWASRSRCVSANWSAMMVRYPRGPTEGPSGRDGSHLVELPAASSVGERTGISSPVHT